MTTVASAPMQEQFRAWLTPEFRRIAVALYRAVLDKIAPEDDWPYPDQLLYNEVLARYGKKREEGVSLLSEPEGALLFAFLEMLMEETPGYHDTFGATTVRDLLSRLIADLEAADA